jgi:iron complex outermembrane receptor protein
MRNLILSNVIAALLASAATSVASAQERSEPQTDTLAEVVVTGSRIKRAGFETLQPAMVVGADAIADRAIVNVADALKDVPAFGVPGGSPVGGQSALAVGQNFVNFFGLGSQRTLTLVDGRRFVPANTPAVGTGISPGLQVDLNTIPAALIDRVETIAVGGAPVYGADAIAGTVNIIRKRNFEGFDALLHASDTEHGGGERQRCASRLRHELR